MTTVYMVLETRIFWNDEYDCEEPVETKLLGVFSESVKAENYLDRVFNSRIEWMKANNADSLGADGWLKLDTFTSDTSSRTVVLGRSDYDCLILKYQYRVEEIVLDQGKELV